MIAARTVVSALAVDGGYDFQKSEILSYTYKYYLGNGIKAGKSSFSSSWAAAIASKHKKRQGCGTLTKMPWACEFDLQAGYEAEKQGRLKLG